MTREEKNARKRAAYRANPERSLARQKARREKMTPEQREAALEKLRAYYRENLAYFKAKDKLRPRRNRRSRRPKGDPVSKAKQIMVEVTQQVRARRQRESLRAFLVGVV